MGHGFPLNVTDPSEAQIDHELKVVKWYCFAAAVSGWHMGALIINLAGDKVPPEDLEQHFEIQVSRETAFSRGRWLHRVVVTDGGMV